MPYSSFPVLLRRYAHSREHTSQQGIRYTVDRRSKKIQLTSCSILVSIRASLMFYLKLSLPISLAFNKHQTDMTWGMWFLSGGMGCDDSTIFSSLAAETQGHIVGVQWKFDLKRCQRRPDGCWVSGKIFGEVKSSPQKIPEVPWFFLFWRCFFFMRSSGVFHVVFPWDWFAYQPKMPIQGWVNGVLPHGFPWTIWAHRTYCWFIHPGRLTWNLQITHLERKIIWTKPPWLCANC